MLSIFPTLRWAIFLILSCVTLAMGSAQVFDDRDAPVSSKDAAAVTITVGENIQISEVTDKLPTCRTLVINDWGLRHPKDFDLFAKIISGSSLLAPNLRSLCFQNLEIFPPVLKALQELRVSKLTGLKFTHILNKGELMGCLGRVLPEMKLEHLDLSGNKLSHADIQCLAEILPRCSSLRVLNLSHNNMIGGGMISLAGIVDKCGALEEIYLADIQGDDKGVVALAKALTASRVKRLDISSNNVGVRAMQALAETISNSSLEHLDVSFNRVGESGLRALIPGLKISQLCSLVIKENAITSRQAPDGSVMIDTAQGMRAWRFFLGEQLISDLSGALPETLQALNLTGYVVSQDAIDAMLQAHPMLNSQYTKFGE